MNWLLVVLLFAGHAHHKPSAPVSVELTQQSLGGGDYEVTLTARPTRDLESLDLSLDGREQHIGKARAKVAHTMTARVHLVGPGRKVFGAAVVTFDGRQRSIADEVLIGKEPAAARMPSKIVVMPDGTRVDEVRP